jgi:hypothetical protein
MLEVSARSKPKNTGGYRPNLTDFYSLGKSSMDIVMKDIYIEDPTIKTMVGDGASIEHDDGGTIGVLLYQFFFQKSFGGHTFGPFDFTRYKTLANEENEDGKHQMRKESYLPISSQLFRNNFTIRRMQKDAFDTIERLVLEQMGVELPLWDMFMEEYQKDKMAEKATERLIESIINSNEFGRCKVGSIQIINSSWVYT